MNYGDAGRAIRTVLDVIGVVPVDQSTCPLDRALRGGVYAGRPDAELDAAGRVRIAADARAVVRDRGTGQHADGVAVDEPRERVRLPVDLPRDVSV